MRHFLNLVQDEVEDARRSSPPIASYHEGYAVILEECDAVWEEIKKKRPDHEALRYELVRIAALCFRFVEDRGLLWDGNAREPLEVSHDCKHTD